MTYALATLAAIEALVCAVYGPRAWAKRWWNILIALDQLACAIAGGDPRETLSSRAAKRLHKRGWHLLGWVLDKLDPGHMARSRRDDVGEWSAWD